MVDLVLRPSTLAPDKPWALQLRWHESLGETEYYTLARVSEDAAEDIIRAGAPNWLFNEPDTVGLDLKSEIIRLRLENQTAMSEIAKLLVENERLHERCNIANYRADNLHADLEKANAELGQWKRNYGGAK